MTFIKRMLIVTPSIITVTIVSVMPCMTTKLNVTIQPFNNHLLTFMSLFELKQCQTYDTYFIFIFFLKRKENNLSIVVKLAAYVQQTGPDCSNIKVKALHLNIRNWGPVQLERQQTSKMLRHLN